MASDGDTELVRTVDALVAGQPVALARIARLVTGKLRALGAYDLRSEWEDICQEVVMALVRARERGGVDTPGRIRAFVRQTTFNHYCDWIRAKHRRPQLVRGPAGDGPQTDPVEAMADEDAPSAASADLLDLLDRLVPELRYALYGHLVAGMTFEELAAELDVSRATAVRRVKEAREELARLYQETPAAKAAAAGVRPAAGEDDADAPGSGGEKDPR